MNLIKWRLSFPFPDDDVKPINFNKIIIHYNNGFSSSTFPGLSERIDKSWEYAINWARLRNMSLPVNKPQFRLAGIQVESKGILLKVGPTTYKQYIAFRKNAILYRWTKSKSQRLGIEVTKFLPNMLSTVALILTKDSRSFGVYRRKSGYIGYLDIPTGYPDPSFVKDFQKGRELHSTNFTREIREELINSLLREIEKRFGISFSSVQQPIEFLGILQNVNNILTPYIVFILRTTLSADDIKNYFVSLKHIPKDFVIFDPFNPEDQLKKYRMTPMMEAAITLTQKAGAHLKKQA